MKLTADSSSITATWTTNVPASSFVEYGTTELSNSAGDPALATQHSVRLPGLQSNTSYGLRLRSSDGLRNVALSPVSTVLTVPPVPAGAPATPTPTSPIPTSYPFAYLEVTSDFTPVTFTWSAVTSPAGNPVEYQFQLSDSVSFPATRYDTGWIPTRQFVTPAPGLPSWPWYDGYYRVRARDAVTQGASAWSTPIELYIYNLNSY